MFAAVGSLRLVWIACSATCIYHNLLGILLQAVPRQHYPEYDFCPVFELSQQSKKHPRCVTTGIQFLKIKFPCRPRLSPAGFHVFFDVPHLDMRGFVWHHVMALLRMLLHPITLLQQTTSYHDTLNMKIRRPALC